MNTQPSTPLRGSGGCKCKPPKEGENPGRNLVVCIDGTSNKFSAKNTNVIELYSQLVKDKTQLTYYNSGIGTYAKPSWRSLKYLKQVLDNKIDLAIAWNFEKIVINAYRWLAENYRDNDRIFLFGFSRGAYQVRTLAGMIDKVGLIYKGNEEQISFAYELYADPTSSGAGASTSGIWRKFWSLILGYLLMLWSYFSKPMAEPVKNQGLKEKENTNLADCFKRTFSRKDVRVHFTGVWDTVSSIGIIRDKNLPGTVSPGHTCFFRHALALDERRVKFLPEYACGGVMIDEGTHSPRDSSDQALGDTPGQARQPPPKENLSPHIKEVWFPGTHSDIGGGNVINDGLDRRHPAFLWMAYEASSAQLRVNPSNVEWKWEELGAVNESLTRGWVPFEHLPFKRLTYRDANSHTWSRHRGLGRQIQPGQKVHASVAFCKSNDYDPKASLPLGTSHSWHGLVGRGERNDSGWTTGWEDLLEMDIFDPSAASTIFQEPLKSENIAVWAHRLTVMTWSGEGRKALRGVYNAAGRLVDMTKERTETDIHLAVANAILETFGDDPKLNDYMATLRDRVGSTGRELFLRKIICNARPSDEKLESIATLVEAENRSTKIDGSEQMNKSLRKRLGCEIVETLLDGLKDKNSRQLAINGVVGLARHCDLRRKILNSEVIDSLLLPIRGEEQNVSQRAPKAIAVSTQNDDLPDTAEVPSQENGDSEEDVPQSTLDGVIGLAKYDDLRCKLDSDIVVGALLRILRDKNWKNYRPTLNAITELGIYDDFRRKMLDSDILVPLLRKLGECSVDLYVDILKTITQFAKDGSLPRKMLDADVVMPLLQRLGDKDPRVHQSVLNTITQLARHDDSHDKMSLNSNIIMDVLKWIKDRRYPYDIVQDAITELAKYDDLRRRIDSKYLLENLGYKSWVHQFIFIPVKCGIISRGHILGFIRPWDMSWNVRRSVPLVITELAKYADSRRNMVNSDIVTAVLKSLEDDDQGVRQATLSAIGELAKHDDSRSNMLDSDSGIVGTILKRLGDESGEVSQAALNAITELTKHENSSRKLLETDFVKIQFKNLGDESPVVRRSALRAITELAKHNDSRSNMVDSGIVTAVLKSLEDGHADVRQATLDAIAELVKHDDSRSNMLDSDSGIVGTILKRLEDESGEVSQAASNVIMELEKHENSSRNLLEFVGIQSENLRDYSCIVRQSALRVITELAKYDDPRRKMVDSDIVKAVLKSLEDGDEDVRWAALSAIAELAKHDDSRSNMLDSDSGIVGTILKRLEDVSGKVSQAAYNVIMELEKHENSSRNLLGFVGIQSKNLRDDSWVVRRSALRVITELAKYVDSRGIMVDSNIVTAVLKSLEDGHADVRWATLNAIAELAKHDDSRGNMLDSDSGIVGTILRRLGDESGEVDQAASNIIMELAKHENSSRKLLDFVGIQFKNLRDKSWAVRRSALRVITELARYDVFRRQMLYSVFVAAILESLRDSGGDVRHTALNAIMELAKHDDLRTNILGHNVVAALLESLGDTEWDILRAALDVVAEFAKYENSRTMILNSNIVASILPLLKHVVWILRRSALNATTELAKYDDSRRELLDSGIIEAVSENLRDKYEDVCREALNVTKELAKHDDSRHKLGDDIVSNLFARLEDGDHDTRRSILDALTVIATHDDLCRQRLDSYFAMHLEK